MNKQIYEEACTWFVDFRAGEIDNDARRQFDAWIRKSPEHLRAYLEITEIWQDASFVAKEGNGDLAPEQLVASARTEPDNLFSLKVPATTVVAEVSQVSPRNPVRAKFIALAASISVAAVSVASWVYVNGDSYSTATGEQRTVRLLDGSTIELNSQSKVRVRYRDGERNVELLAGQALFRVAKDAQRPFVVKTGETKVRAVGTQFDVYRKVSGTTVTVLEGRVAVDNPATARVAKLDATSGTIFLAAGEQLTIPVRNGAELSAQPAPPAVTYADVETATAWTQQRLVFKSTPLAAVAEEFNRYNPRQLRIDCGTGDPQSDPCNFKISGVYSSTDPTVLIRFLRDQPGIAVDEAGDGIVVTPR